MSKIIRALALFSLTIGLAGCFHSDDDTVFVTRLGAPDTGGPGTTPTTVTVTGPETTVTLTVEVIDTSDIITDDDATVNAAPIPERPAEDPVAMLNSDGDDIPDIDDPDDNNDGILDTDDPNFIDANDNSIDDTAEADAAPQTIVQASGENPGFPFSSFQSSGSDTSGARSAQVGVGIEDSASGTRTPTNIVYGPRADLGLVEFDGGGNRVDRRVIPQIAAYEVINARVDQRRYAYYGEADEGDNTDPNNNPVPETAYFVEQGAMMQFAALAYWIDSPSDALDFSTVHELSEIGAGVFGLETAAANLPRGRAEYRGAINGIYRKSTSTEINTGLTIRPDVAANRDNDLSNDEVYSVVLRTGAQNYLVEGPVNVTAEFALSRINGGFTAMAYEPNYRLDYTPESLADYDPTATDETFGQWLGNGRYYLPNRGGLRVAPAGIIAIPTIPVLDPVSGRPTFDINGIPIRADAVVLPETTALDTNGNPIRAGVDPQGVQILDPAAQIAIRYSPLSGTPGPGDTWVPDDEAALAIRRSLANTLPDPFTRLRPQVPVIPSILQGRFSGNIINGRFTAETQIAERTTTAPGTTTRTVRQFVKIPSGQIGSVGGDEAVVDAQNNRFTFPDGDVLVSRVIGTTNVPVTSSSPIEPTGVFSPLADGTGDILGQFFGPNGEETAGSGNLADMDGNELVFAFGGRQIGLIPPDTLPPETADLLAERARLIGRFDDLVSIILPDSVFEDPANLQVVDTVGTPGAFPSPFQRLDPTGTLRLFVPTNVDPADIATVERLSNAFAMNPGVVDIPAMLDVIDPTGRLTP